MSLRQATAADAGDIARLHRHVMRVSLPFLPELHTPHEDLWFVSERLLPANEVWVAEVEGLICGYIAFRSDWVEHLYIHPAHQGRGLGDTLLAQAKLGARMLSLWAFQQNVRARAFYERRGFVVVRETDGSGNEEKTPDVLYEWRAG